MVLPFLTGIFAVITMLVGNTLYALLDQILKSHIPLSVICRLVVFNIPSLVVLTLPVGVALSAALAVNRLVRDSELTPIRITGTPLRRIFLPIFVTGAIASVFSFWMSEQIVPRAQAEFQKTQSAMIGYAMSASPDLISNRVFTYENYSFFVNEASKGVPGRPDALLVRGVTIYESPTNVNDFPRLITAKTAIYDGGNWTLRDADVHILDSSGFTSIEAYSPSLTLPMRAPIPMLGDTSTGFAGQPDQYTMAELSRQIALLQRTGQDSTPQEVAFQFKMALPFLCLAFALCAPALSFRFARTGSFMGIFLSIVMVFVAWNTLLLTKALGLSGYIPPVLSAWAPDILFAAIGLVLLWRSE
jgi:lipopolysaccharide export system permease protein